MKDVRRNNAILSERRINPFNGRFGGKNVMQLSILQRLVRRSGLIQPRTEPTRRNDNALHGDS
jgi:hypothetical protein